MKDQLKTLSKETLIYGMSTVVGRFLNFLLVPFYINVLHSTAEYGITTSLYTYIGFLNVIYTFGLEAAYFRYGARGEGESFEPEREKKLFSSPFLFILIVVSLFTMLLMVLAPWVIKPLFYDPKIDISPMAPALTVIVRYGAGVLFFDNLSSLPFAVLRLEHQAVRFAAIRLTGILVTLALNFVFVMGLGLGVEGIFLANLLSSMVVLIFLLPTILPRLNWRIDPDVLRKFLPFGLTNVPAYISSMMVQVIDRPIVQAYLGLGILGVYQANYRLGFVMMVFVSLFEYAWRPFFMRQSLKDDRVARQLFARVFTFFMVIALVGFLALSWGLPYVVSVPFHGHRLFKPAYLAGLPIIPVVLLAYVFQGMYTNFIAGIYIKERNKVLPWITGIGALVNILTNLWLIPRVGIMGAAVATLLAYMAMAFAIYGQAQKVYFVPYEWEKIRRFTSIVGSAFILERFLTLSQMVIRPGALLIIRGALLAIVLVVLRTGKFLSLNDTDLSVGPINLSLDDRQDRV